VRPGPQSLWSIVVVPHAKSQGPSSSGLALTELLEHLVDRPGHVEVLLRNLVVLAFYNRLEAPDRVGDGDVLPIEAGELLGDKEGLRQELLNLARARHGQLVVFRQLIDAENRNDVLQVLVTLENLLHLARDVIVLLTDDA